MSKIGFIGAGNMATAIIGGIIEAKVFAAGKIFVYDILQEKVADLHKQFGVKAADSVKELVESVDTIVLSVKPQTFVDVLEGVKDHVNKDQTVISIAAGITTERIAKFLPNNTIIRVMPNTPALVGEGAAALYSGNASIIAMDSAVQIFEAVGIAVVVETEGLIDAVTAISGSGPAYYFKLMEAMVTAGVKLGLDAETAKQLVLQTAKGAAVLACNSADEPAELRKKVTSPGGTTAAALKAFEDGNIDGLVETALTAARDRSIELSG